MGAEGRGPPAIRATGQGKAAPPCSFGGTVSLPGAALTRPASSHAGPAAVEAPGGGGRHALPAQVNTPAGHIPRPEQLFCTEHAFPCSRAALFHSQITRPPLSHPIIYLQPRRPARGPQGGQRAAAPQRARPLWRRRKGLRLWPFTHHAGVERTSRGRARGSAPRVPGRVRGWPRACCGWQGLTAANGAFAL